MDNGREVLNAMQKRHELLMVLQLTTEGAFEYKAEDGTLTTEGIGSFVAHVKEFFRHILSKIGIAMGNSLIGVEKYSKYFDDKIRSLNNMSRDISKLNGVGFSTIEDIKVPVMMGMKPKYSDLVFELNNLIEEFKKAETFATEFNVFLTKLVTDNVGLRLSNDPKLFTNANEVSKLAERTSKIIEEITETRKPTDIKPVKDIFYNISTISTVKDNYVKLFKDTIAFNTNEFKIEIERMCKLLDAWISTLDSKDEVKASTNVLNKVKTLTSDFAVTTTNVGVYLAYLNQSSGFFIDTPHNINNKIGN